jgi:hypothetical protein
MELTEISVPSRLTYGYGTQDNESMQSIIDLEPSLEVMFSPAVNLSLSTRLRFDGDDEIEPGKPQRDNYSSISKPLAFGSDGSAELRDAYLEISLPRAQARVGKQQIVWGKLDGIKILDVLNPQDYREFILSDFDESRISLWSAYLDLSLGEWRAELAFLPDATGHAIPERGAWFELTAPRFRYGVSGPANSVPVITDHSNDIIDDSGMALRLSRPVGPVDISAVAYSGLDFQPLGQVIVRDGNPTLEQFYKRRELFGASAEYSWGPVAVRAEAAVQPERKFNTRDGAQLSTVSRDQLQLALAADIQGPLDVFINLQFLIDEVDDAPNTLVRPKKDRIVTAYLRRQFSYDVFSATFRAYHSLEDNDSMFSAKLGYKLTDDTELQLGADGFDGDREGLFGQFSDRDRITLGVEHTF